MPKSKTKQPLTSGCHQPMAPPQPRETDASPYCGAVMPKRPGQTTGGRRCVDAPSAWNLGRARNTVEAYGRALDDHLRFCGSIGVDPLTLRPDVVAAWIGDLHARPNPFRMKLRHLDSRAGLSSATIQQRIIAVRSFYEHLVEDGLRERNPVRRGESGRRGGPSNGA